MTPAGEKDANAPGCALAANLLASGGGGGGLVGRGAARTGRADL